MKKQNSGSGLMMTGSFRSGGVTFYLRQGKVVGRVAHSSEKRSNTMAQFVQRQRMRHSVALWQRLKPCSPMFTEHKSPYYGFASFANRMQAVYLPKTGSLSTATLLLPGIPVSDGTLPVVKQWLGEVDGTAALLTDLKANGLRRGERLMLYTAEQQMEKATPKVFFSVRNVKLSEMREVDGCMALVDNEFGDTMKGWALVRTSDERCSPQTIVTRCEYYRQYTTDEALEAAVKTYGGITRN